MESREVSLCFLVATVLMNPIFTKFPNFWEKKIIYLKLQIVKEIKERKIFFR